MATISLNPTTGQIELTPEEIAEIASQVPAGAQGPMGIPGLPGPQGIQGIQGIQGPPGVCPCNQPTQWWPDTFTTFINSLYKNEPADPWQGIPKARLVNDLFTPDFQDIDSNKLRASLDGIDPPHGIVWYDIEHWNPYGTNPENLAALQRLILVINLSKAYRPDLKYGYYSLVPPRDYWNVINGTPEPWEQNQQYVEPLRDVVDIFFPSIYAFYDTPTDSFDRWEIYARANIQAVQGFGKPIYPFIWPNLHDGGSPSGSPYTGDEYFRRMLDVCYDEADGVVIWGAGFHGDFPNREDYIPNPDWFQVLQQFYTDNGLGEPMSLALKYDFVNHKTLVGSPGPTPTCTRASDGTYFDSSGVLQTATSNTARFDHDPADSNASLGLLVEEARTNICLRSEDFTATWANAAGTFTAGQASLDGGTTATDILESGSGRTEQNVTIVADTAYTFSMFVKQGLTGSHDWVQLQYWLSGTGGTKCSYNISTGALGTQGTFGGFPATGTDATITDVGGGWYRISITGIIGNSQTSATCTIRNTTADNSDTIETTNSVIWWGGQIEAGTFKSSYIPTTTASVTRAADNIATTDVSWHVAAGNSWYVSWSKYGVGDSDNIFEGAGNSNQDFIALQVQANTQPKMDLWDDNVNVVPKATGITTVADTVYEYAAGWSDAGDDFIHYQDGVSGGTDTSFTVPQLDIALTIGNKVNATSALQGHVRELRYYNTRLTNAQLENMSNGVFPSTSGNISLGLTMGKLGM